MKSVGSDVHSIRQFPSRASPRDITVQLDSTVAKVHRDFPFSERTALCFSNNILTYILTYLLLLFHK